jgi:biotin carboxyl carrier protein
MSEKKVTNQIDCEDKKQRCKTLVIDGTKYRTFYNRKFENRKKYQAPDPNKIVSFIPGTVVKVLVKQGQEVHKGDTILLLDAMKMKTRLTVDTPGRIKSINVSEGIKIPKDFLMIELDPII